MKKIYLAITLICLTLGVALALTIRRPSGSIPYTIDYRVTEVDASGKVVSSYEEHRLQSANGNWKYVKVYEDGTVHTLFCDLERGSTFKVQNDRLIYVSACVLERPVTKELLLQSPSSTGKVERVLGYETVAQKPAGSETTFYRSPALNSAILKMVSNSGDGYVVTREAVKLTAGEPDAKRMTYPKDLPVDNSFFEKRQQK